MPTMTKTTMSKLRTYRGGATLRYIAKVHKRPSQGWEVRQHRILPVFSQEKKVLRFVQLPSGSLLGVFNTQREAHTFAEEA